MTYQERNNLVSILTNLLVNAYIFWRVFTMYQAGDFAGEDALMLWARTVLWAIPLSIVITIIATILFTILFAIATREENPDSVIDERDKLFGQRGMIAVVSVASAGFILACVALAFGWSAFAAMNIIYAGFALGSLAGGIVSIYFYRRGY